MNLMVMTAVIGIAGAAAVAVWAGAKENSPPALAVLDAPVDAEMIELGAGLYAESCASCHGADLEGQPDWRRRLDNGPRRRMMKRAIRGTMRISSFSTLPRTGWLRSCRAMRATCRCSGGF